MKNTIQDFIIGQMANAESEQAAKLAFAIREAITEYKENGGDNENSFSVDAKYENGEFKAQCSFSEDMTMTVMYYEGSDNEVVKSLFNLQNESELCRLAGLMLSNGWVSGFNG
ncbi:TPA: hypothetical protein MCU09_005651 [Klebsiella pneumoniae]|uniref:hypothetical protein n=1 Tax=Klebsiella pneumoniae TaxID=573 RepID=UPI001777A495|nr:hypothetical protein [Klebsiella pneumoniae]HAG7917823.1 hypothetical protein [Escherichia coli]HBH8547209.1 hypothetical protein [Escherichia coli]HBU2533321.1 hypothetical protein [Klebsiella pneumoniae]HEE0775917.1 hypothetical protein [Klebsiella pneumoniae]